MYQNYTDGKISSSQHTLLQESTFLGYKSHLQSQLLEEEKIWDRS